MTNNYIVLTDSVGALSGFSKRFKALELREPRMKTDGFQMTLAGTIDKSTGTILRSWNYQLRVPFSVTDDDYGTYDDLVMLFELGDPNGVPNDVITLTDHYGDDFEVYFVGKLDPQNMITVLDSENSRFLVAIELREKV